MQWIEGAEVIKTLVGLAEDLDSVPSTAWPLTTVTPVPGIVTPPLLASAAAACIWHTFVYAGNAYTCERKKCRK